MSLIKKICIIAGITITILLANSVKELYNNYSINKIDKEKLELELKVKKDSINILNIRLDSVQKLSKQLLLSNQDNNLRANYWEARALSCIGRPYVYGAMSKKVGFDCSGLVLYALGKKRNGKLGSSARTIFSRLKGKSNDVRKGTLVFFSNLSHIGIMLSKNKFIHASTSHGVTVSYLDSYWRSKVCGFKNV